ncbi:putative RNA-directed DNA polymerase (Reverse transcriptase), Ribonuclease H [Hibiscus syriacus]|uniref:RNA-directed DNA polymerase (Reverse transcriptase), Ribonuclease H n=1 Tax=Hibiscus syriacus TaxID=106335 RepID=A0A6A2YHX3_HIBSY|nr:putative RNA-directed DNA polymerase (Reverse transcriptase), Ribonuclease H [Hibiscus syriacus]
MDKKFYDQTKYDAAKKRHPEGTLKIEESYAPKDRMPIEEKKEIREIREQMSKMMDRISVLAKREEIPAQKERELNEPNSVMSDTQGTFDLNQFEKLQTIIIRIHKLSRDTEEMMTTVQSKTKCGSHVDAIPISYKELYENLLEAREVDPYYIKPFQPPYPNCLVIEDPARSTPNVFKGNSISRDVQNEEDLLRFEAQICHLNDQNDKLSTEMEGIQEDFKKVSQAFQNAGIGNTPEEWIIGVTKLKKNCNIHEGRAKKFYHNSRVADERCNTSVSELKRCQVENQMLNSAMTNMEVSYQIHQLEIDTELKATMAKNKTLKKCVDDYGDLMKEKDNIIKEAAAQANNVAHKLVDLAGFTRELRQIDNSIPEYEWNKTKIIHSYYFTIIMKTMEQSYEGLQDQWPEQLTGLPQDIRKETSDSVPDGSNQIIQCMASDKEEIIDKEQPCCHIEESKMVKPSGASQLNPKNNLVHYSQYEERFKWMDEAIRNMKCVDTFHKELEARELSLVPDLVIPHDFKMPDFEKYDGTSCPLIHLRMFCRKMEGYLSSDDLLIHSFHDSLVGPTVVWYNQLTQEQIKRWVDLADAFLEQYRYVKCLAPTRMDLQRVKKKTNERFQEYSLRWRGVAAQVQPPILEEEISRMFRDSLPAPFFELIQANPTKEFENLVTSGDLIENVINEENSKVTSRSPTDQKAKPDHVNECRIQSPHNYKRKRASNCSDRPKKVIRSRKILEMFQTSISDLYPHLVKGQYITPRPTKVTSNPSAHSYDQDSVCNFHLGVKGHSTGNCRPLLKEIEMLVDKGVLTQEMIKKWGANEEKNPDPITYPTL